MIQTVWNCMHLFVKAVNYDRTAVGPSVNVLLKLQQV